MSAPKPKTTPPSIEVEILEPAAPPAWPDLEGKLDTYLLLGPAAPPIRALIIPGGMPDGSSAFVLRFELPDGRTLLAATSGRDFVKAADAFRARGPEVDA